MRIITLISKKDLYEEEFLLLPDSKMIMNGYSGCLKGEDIQVYWREHKEHAIVNLVIGDYRISIHREKES